MNTAPKMHLLLAEDDPDDCFFFKEALEELTIMADLSIVSNGEELMQFLENISRMPTALFLDINMPRKNGIECLIEIRQKAELKDLPVIMYSTSYEEEMAMKMYKLGAHSYIQKPSEFLHLKAVILKAINRMIQSKPDEDNFLISPT